MVKLAPMTTREKGRQLKWSRQQYTVEMAAADSLAAEEADLRVQEQLERSLPEGFETPEHSFMWIVANHDQERVGWTWVGPALGDSGAHYIYELQIDAAFRGGGLGGSALDQIEVLAGEAGADRVDSRN